MSFMGRANVILKMVTNKLDSLKRTDSMDREYINTEMATNTKEISEII